MIAFINIQENIGKQFHMYRELEHLSNRELRDKVYKDIKSIHKDTTHNYEDLDKHLAGFIPEASGCEMLGSDVMIPCLIYVYTKALMPEIVALLAVIHNFTLQKYADEFSFVEKTMQGLDVFIRNEMHKLD